MLRTICPMVGVDRKRTAISRVSKEQPINLSEGRMSARLRPVSWPSIDQAIRCLIRETMGSSQALVKVYWGKDTIKGRGWMPFSDLTDHNQWLSWSEGTGASSPILSEHAQSSRRILKNLLISSYIDEPNLVLSGVLHSKSNDNDEIN